MKPQITVLKILFFIFSSAFRTMCGYILLFITHHTLSRSYDTCDTDIEQALTISVPTRRPFYVVGSHGPLQGHKYEPLGKNCQ